MGAVQVWKGSDVAFGLVQGFPPERRKREAVLLSVHEVDRHRVAVFYHDPAKGVRPGQF